VDCVTEWKAPLNILVYAVARGLQNNGHIVWQSYVMIQNKQKTQRLGVKVGIEFSSKEIARKYAKVLR